MLTARNQIRAEVGDYRGSPSARVVEPGVAHRAAVDGRNGCHAKPDTAVRDPAGPAGQHAAGEGGVPCRAQEQRRRDERGGAVVDQKRALDQRPDRGGVGLAAAIFFAVGLSMATLGLIVVARIPGREVEQR